MHILDHQPHPGRRPPGHRGQHLRHPGEQSLPAPRPVPAIRARAAAWPQPRQQPPHFFSCIPGERVQRRRQQPAALQPAQLTERVRHRQQRERARQRQAVPPHRYRPRRHRPVHGLGHEPGLAYPRVPHHQHQPHIAAQRPQEAGQLTLTANKARRASHVPSPPAWAPLVNPVLPPASPRGFGSRLLGHGRRDRASAGCGWPRIRLAAGLVGRGCLEDAGGAAPREGQVEPTHLVPELHVDLAAAVVLHR